MSNAPIISHVLFLKRLYKASSTTEQKRLAQIADVTTGSMSRIQSGQSMPSVETLARIAVSLNTTIDYLIGLSDSPRPSQRKTADRA